MSSRISRKLTTAYSEKHKQCLGGEFYLVAIPERMLMGKKMMEDGGWTVCGRSEREVVLLLQELLG